MKHILPTRTDFLVLIFLALCIWVPLLTTNAFAADVTLAWNPSQRADGYRLFVREQNEPYDYDNHDWSGTETTCTIYGLDETANYFFVVRAFNEFGESRNSNEAALIFVGGQEVGGGASGGDAGGGGGCFIVTSAIDLSCR